MIRFKNINDNYVMSGLCFEKGWGHETWHGSPGFTSQGELSSSHNSSFESIESIRGFITVT